MNREIFAVGRGQYENIGDVLLRRPLLDWAREAGHLHVYVGDSPDGYDEALGLQPEDVVYRSFTTWYAALLKAATRGRADSLYKPGELQLTLIGMKEHVAMLPAVALVRARGGRVARIGAGARNFAPLARAIMWPSNRLSSYTRWRDERTAAYLGFGAAMPDLAFADEPGDEASRTETREPEAKRDLLVVSLREDAEVAPRPYPDAAWFDEIREAAGRLGLRIAVATQVSVDDARTQRLARDLGADEVVGWPAAADHGAQEQRLRALYRRAQVVASDRLHVIIAGYTEGAAPVGLQLDDATKISRHFDTIGVRDITINTAALAPGELATRIEAIAGRRDELLALLPAARARLREIRSDLHALLTRRRDAAPRSTTSAWSGAHGRVDSMTRPTVFHVGRAGDVPGGMTQVVNAYLGWDFERADVDVIVSRGDPGDHATAARQFARARRTISRLARSDAAVVLVVHLSERGSFVREGHLARYAARLGLPVIAHLHGSEFVAYEARHAGRVAEVLRVCAHVITLSEEASAIAARTVGADHVTLVPNAVPGAAAREKKNSVVFGGVVSHRKGIDVLQEAWRRLAPEHPDWTLHVAGPLRDEELVDHELASTRFLGSVSHATLMSLLEEASVAVLPSRDEAMPMFILEALARRAAVVSSTVGGIPAVLGDEHGVLTPPGDVDALTAALRRLLADETYRRRLAERGHQRFLASYSAAAVFPVLEDLWLAPLGAIAATDRAARLISG